MRNRRLARAPIWLYRHRLGALFGDRLLMLEHVGRRSGARRYVCLEVVEQRDLNTFVIVSGFGETAQWYRNLRSNPVCHVSVGRRRRIPARARQMGATESHQSLMRYQQAHRAAWRHLRGVIEQAVHQPVSELPMVELTLTDSRPTSPLATTTG